MQPCHNYTSPRLLNCSKEKKNTIQLNQGRFLKEMVSLISQGNCKVLLQNISTASITAHCCVSESDKGLSFVFMFIL